METIYAAIILLSLFVFSSFTLAQDADEIASKYVNAIGGMDKILAIQTLKMSGKFSANGMDIPFTQTYKRPDRFLMQLTMQGMTMKQAFDGTQGSSINPFTGKKDPDLVPQDLMKAIKRQSEFEGQLVNYKAKGSKIELIGKEDFEGSQVFNIKLTDKDGDVSNMFIDVESYLLIKIKDKLKFDTKEIESETMMSNYKDVNGVLMPFALEVKVPGSPMGTQKITIDKFEPNIAVADSIFKMPVTK